MIHQFSSQSTFPHGRSPSRGSGLNPDLFLQSLQTQIVGSCIVRFRQVHELAHLSQILRSPRVVLVEQTQKGTGNDVVTSCRHVVDWDELAIIGSFLIFYLPAYNAENILVARIANDDTEVLEFSVILEHRRHESRQLRKQRGDLGHTLHPLDQRMVMPA